MDTLEKTKEVDASFERTATAAQAVGLSRNFLYRHAAEIPAARRAGRALRWDICELKKWMAAQAHSKPDTEAVAR